MSGSAVGERRRVVVVHNRYRSAQPSGEDSVVDQECDLIASLGHEVVRYERHSDSITTMSPLRRAELPARVSWSLDDYRALAALLRERRPDIVHVHNTFPLISASIFRATSEAGIPVVATLHNFRLVCADGTLQRQGRACTLCVTRGPGPALRHKCYRGSRAATVPLAVSIGMHRHIGTWQKHVDTFVVMSEFARALLTRAGFERKQFVVKPHFVDDPAELRAGPGDYFLYVGRLSSEKGVDVLLDAWDRSLGRLLIVGDGPLRQELERSAVRHGDSVSFLGTRPRDSAMKLMTRARAVVSPSRAYETFGLAAVEAMAHGVPAVVPAHGVFREVVDDGVSGMHFVPADAADLRRALVEVSNPTRSVAMGARAREVYLARYTRSANAALLDRIYDNAIVAAAGQGRGDSHTRF